MLFCLILTGVFQFESIITPERFMYVRLLFMAVFLFTLDAVAAIGDGDSADFIPLPGEFCNHDSDQKQRDLFKAYPKDEGIINLYALYLGLCQLVIDGRISEQTASIQWAIERNKLIEKRKSVSNDVSR
jgi:hypothetical protein